jgi:hypothetical protein
MQGSAFLSLVNISSSNKPNFEVGADFPDLNAFPTLWHRTKRPKRLTAKKPRISKLHKARLKILGNGVIQAWIYKDLLRKKPSQIYKHEEKTKGTGEMEKLKDYPCKFRFDNQ